jgi:hypothetical protein
VIPCSWKSAILIQIKESISFASVLKKMQFENVEKTLLSNHMSGVRF